MHAIAHAVGALFNTHHGLTNAILMPYVMQANRRAIGELMDQLAPCLGLGEGGFDGVYQWILELREEVGIPQTLAEIGVDQSAADEIGQRAVKDPTAGGNPMPLDAAAYADIFRQACAGEG